MQMRAGRAAGSAHGAEYFTLADFLAFDDIHSRKVRVPCLVIVAVIDNHAAAVAAIPARMEDDPIRRRMHRSARGRGNIDAGVHGAFARERIAADAIAGHQTPVDGPHAREHVHIAAGENIALAPARFVVRR